MGVLMGEALDRYEQMKQYRKMCMWLSILAAAAHVFIVLMGRSSSVSLLNLLSLADWAQIPSLMGWIGFGFMEIRARRRLEAWLSTPSSTMGEL